MMSRIIRCGLSTSTMSGIMWCGLSTWMMSGTMRCGLCGLSTWTMSGTIRCGLSTSTMSGTMWCAMRFVRSIYLDDVGGLCGAIHLIGDVGDYVVRSNYWDAVCVVYLLGRCQGLCGAIYLLGRCGLCGLST